MLRDKDGLLQKDFTRPLGKVSYHVPCHSRVQNIGQKTREVLEWIPEIARRRRSSAAPGHDGTYGVKSEFYAASMKIGKPVFRPDGAGRAGLRESGLPDRRPPHPAGHRRVGASRTARARSIR